VVLLVVVVVVLVANRAVVPDAAIAVHERTKSATYILY
jgi:hypothetical protein